MQNDRKVFQFEISNEDNVNIYLPPENCDVYQYEEIVLGDLHGNAMKLLFTLCKEGIAQITNENYAIISTIYQKNVARLTDDDLANFHKALSKITFTDQAKVHLIGDVLADRGQNDYFTLLLLDAMKNQGVKTRIDLSNHDMDFVLQAEKKRTVETVKFSHGMLVQGGHGPSMLNMEKLIDENKILTKTVIFSLYDQVYKPSLNLLSYNLSEDEHTIILSTHAGVDLDVIKGIAGKLKVKYDASTAIKLAKTIDNINKEFTKKLNQNQIASLVSNDILQLAYHGRSPSNKVTEPIEILLWNRCYNEDFLKREKLLNNDDHIYFMHGHDSSDSKDFRNPHQEHSNVLNLDFNNDLGKSSGQLFALKVENNAAISVENEITPLYFTCQDDGIHLRTQGLRSNYFGSIMQQIETVIAWSELPADFSHENDSIFSNQKQLLPQLLNKLKEKLTRDEPVIYPVSYNVCKVPVNYICQLVNQEKSSSTFRDKHPLLFGALVGLAAAAIALTVLAAAALILYFTAPVSIPVLLTIGVFVGLHLGFGAGVLGAVAGFGAIAAGIATASMLFGSVMGAIWPKAHEKAQNKQVDETTSSTFSLTSCFSFASEQDSKPVNNQPSLMDNLTGYVGGLFASCCGGESDQKKEVDFIKLKK